MSHPKVSVLMSVYNGERYLREAMDSILNQTFKDFEFLIINDSSTDSTQEILLSYADLRIRLVNNEKNLGLTKSLNKGLALARGALIARQDADDVSFPQRLEKQVAFMDAHPEVVVLGTQVRNVNKEGHGFSAKGWEKPQNELGIRWQMIFDSPCVHGTVMFRREIVWDKLHGYNEQFITSQDYELWSRIAADYKICNLGEILVNFRCHDESMSSRYRAEEIVKVETVFLDNLRVALKTENVPAEWPKLWIAITNPQVTERIADGQKIFQIMNSIQKRFTHLYAAATNDRKIKRHLACKLGVVACYFAPFDRGNSLKAYVRAFAADWIYAIQMLGKYLALFLFGETARRFSR